MLSISKTSIFSRFLTVWCRFYSLNIFNRGPFRGPLNTFYLSLLIIFIANIVARYHYY
nr:MAG TPA: hypothetical protein [Caudoviricetes sp.]